MPPLPPLGGQWTAHDLARLHPGAVTTEACPDCGLEQTVPAYAKGRCAGCGREILPCSMCIACQPVGLCPFELP